jgi:hypothetical protein
MREVGDSFRFWRLGAMLVRLTDAAESAPASREGLAPRRHVAALELIAGVALVVSTVVAMAVVTIGIARAETLIF